MANTPVTQIKAFKSTLAVQSFTPTCRRRFCFSIQGNDYVVLPLLCVIHVLSQLQQDNQTPNKVLAIRLPVVIPEVANKESMLVMPGDTLKELRIILLPQLDLSIDRHSEYSQLEKAMISTTFNSL